MKFIAYGCSYTQGAELADDWLTGKHHLTIDKEKQALGVGAFYQKYTKDYDRDKYERIMSQKSYAAKIAASIGPVDYVNKAAAGKSNKAIFLDVLDIEKSAKKNNRYDRGRDASEKLEKEKNLWGHPGPQFHEFVADTVIKKYL